MKEYINSKHNQKVRVKELRKLLLENYPDIVSISNATICKALK